MPSLQPSGMLTRWKSMRRRLAAAARLTALAAALAVAPPSAHAARGDYSTASLTEPAPSGLPVQAPLAELRAVSRARVIVPTAWRPLRSTGGRSSFMTPGGSCRYRVTFTVHTRLAAPSDATQHVEAALPAPGPRYLLDAGQRAGSAFRTIRRKGTGAVVRLAAIRASVLTRRTDIVDAAGQVAWTELRVTATSRSGDECHSGTWRERVGPQISDALATARTTLHFARPA